VTTFMLDTNVCVDVMREPRGVVGDQLRTKLRHADPVVVSVISQLELQAGALASSNPSNGKAILEAFLKDHVAVLAFDTQAMAATADLIHKTRINGRQLPAYDALIAGHAMAIGATLVTADTRLAEVLGEVEVVNWRA
jgi:tRNA(fMet)-specific endonuclease VapC